jgi:hypothetical protein
MTRSSLRKAVATGDREHHDALDVAEQSRGIMNAQRRGDDWTTGQ